MVKRVVQVSTRGTVGALAFAVVFPSIVTLAYFVWLKDHSPAIQQTVYTVGKSIQFAFPLVWVWLVMRRKIRWVKPVRAGLLPGFAFGLAVVFGMWGLYTVLQPQGFFAGPDQEVREKIIDLGLNRLWKYAGVGVFYSLCHSLLEEYYWRWFVFGFMRAYLPLGSAILLSSAGFMAHHVILLATYFGWGSPSTYLFSLAVAVGGAFWSWLYDRSGSLYGPWLSHCFVDAAIFLLGFELARDLLVP